MEIEETAPEAGKTDPRVRRTRIHVIETARAMLAENNEPLSFSSVADRAFVARQTLYKHWGTIDNLLAETIDIDAVGEASFYESLDVTQRAEVFLDRLVEQFDFAVVSAFTAMLASSSYEPSTRNTIMLIDKKLYIAFISRVGNLTHDQFFEVVAPVMFMNLVGATVSRDLIAASAARAAALIN